MRTLIYSFIAALCLTFPVDAHALRIGDSTVIIPIIGRVPGAMGTQWVTDVFLHTIGPASSGTLTFYGSDGTVREANFTLEYNESKTYRDIVRTVFGLENAQGQLHLKTEDGVRIEARARVYNAGNPAGEFGQGIEGIAPSWLQSQARLWGLDGTPASRVNVGVANLNDVAITVSFRVTDRVWSPLHYANLTLQPHQTLQFNDIFAVFNIPRQDNVNVEFYCPPDYRIYGYASEVRNDTGDAVFTFGTGPNAALYTPTSIE